MTSPNELPDKPAVDPPAEPSVKPAAAVVARPAGAAGPRECDTHGFARRVWHAMLRAASALRRLFTEQVLAELPELQRARRTIFAQIADAHRTFGSDESRRLVASKLQVDAARRYLEAETARRKSVEDKAKTNLLGITLAFSVIFAGLSFLGADAARARLGAAWGPLAALVLAVGVAYLIVGGLQAHAAMQVGQAFGPTPEDEASDEPTEHVERILWCLEQNQRLTTLRTNALSASFRAIRNGVLALAVLVITLATLPAGPKDAAPSAQPAGPTVVVCVLPADRPLLFSSLCNSVWPSTPFADWILVLPAPPRPPASPAVVTAGTVPTDAPRAGVSATRGDRNRPRDQRSKQR